MSLSTQDKVEIGAKFNKIISSTQANNRTLQLHQDILLEALKDMVTDVTIQTHALINILYKNGLIDIKEYEEERDRMFFDNDSEYFLKIQKAYEKKIIELEKAIGEEYGERE